MGSLGPRTGGLFGPRAETLKQGKKTFGARIFGSTLFKFWGLAWALWAPALAHYLHGPRAESEPEIGNKKFGKSRRE
jgi:hypothetical protein